MLEPITELMTDETNGKEYRFTFYCDICESPWHSIPYACADGGGSQVQDAREQESEYIAAYKRANREAMTHFNRCPVCKRVVCDDCFRILDEQDVCKECVYAGKK